MARLRKAIHLFIAAILLAGGAGLMIGMIRTKPSPPTVASDDRLPLVEVVRVVPRTSQEPVVGHGTVRPKHQVQVIPQVPGKLIHVHPDLAPGKIIAEGELLFALDATIHEARTDQARAEISGLESALLRHDAESATIDERLANAELMLSIDEKDYQSSLSLYEQEHVGTRRELDFLQHKYLRAKDAVVELRAARSRIPNLRLETRAQLDAARARLQAAEYELSNTKILCPFRARVEAVAAHASQVVSGMAPIAVLTDVAAYEIAVSIDPGELRWLHESVRPQSLLLNGQGPAPDVLVRWDLPGRTVNWRGRVSRFERVDELTRTARMIVEVRSEDRVPASDAANDELDPGLSIGMYCRVELPAAPLTDAIWVPRHALYEDRWVYVVEASSNSIGRLTRRQVPVLRVCGDEVLVDYRGGPTSEASTLHTDDAIVVSPLLKPVEDMKVRAVPVPELKPVAARDDIGAGMFPKPFSGSAAGSDNHGLDSLSATALPSDPSSSG